jgi:hypothetical protein
MAERKLLYDRSLWLAAIFLEATLPLASAKSQGYIRRCD